MELNKEIDELENICKLFLEEDVDDLKEDGDISLKIKAFDELISECKNEVKSSSLDHKKHVLDLLYGIKSYSYELSLEDYVKNQRDIKHIEKDERYILRLKELRINIDKIVEKLAVEHKKALDANKKWYVFNSFKLKKYSSFLIKLMNLRERLEAKLVNHSKKTSFLIIENFYSLYIFFSFLVGLCMYNKNEMLLIEIVNQLDSYIDIIEPSLNHKSLHHSDMLHYYAIYELKELRDQILKELAFQ